ncbi:tetratricopeptide repeat protein [Fulvivirga sp. M361]|nr:tetratricopeptide repeat protein [Fulvivirga sp. M361]
MIQFIRFFFITFSLTVLTPIHAQDKPDSLKGVLSKQTGDTTEVSVLNLLSQSFYLSGDDSTLFYAQKALKLATKIKYQKGIAYAWHHFGTYYFIRHELDSALLYFERSLAIKKEINDERSISGTLNNLGGVYYNLGNYAKAMDNYQQSLTIKLAQGDSIRAAKTINNIGLIHYIQKNYDKALDRFSQALEIKRLKDLGIVASTLSNIGMTHMQREDYTQALRFCKRSYEIYDSLDIKCKRKQSAYNIGYSYLQLNRLDSSLMYLRSSYNDAIACEDQSTLSMALSGLGQAYMKKGLKKQAEEALLKGFQTASQHQLKEKTQEVANKLYDFYKAVGNEKKALEFLEISTDMKEELFNEDLTERLTTMELNFAFEQERDSLEYQKQAELLAINVNLKRQRNLRYLTILGLVITVIFSVVIYRYYELGKKARGILEHKNKTISETLNEREVLLQEIHHRVKNNLQIVSSLLNIQSKYLNDESARKAVLEGRDRIQSMALVHEKLYQSENLSKIDVKEYLEELVNTLFQSYDVSEDRIKLASNIESIDLSIDTTLQVGLLINELVSNALKHAFPAEKHGTISLSLIKKDDVHEVEVSDDGIGINSPDDLEKSYGYRIIRSISRGLNGTILMSDQAEKGTTFKLMFPQ